VSRDLKVGDGAIMGMVFRWSEECTHVQFAYSSACLLARSKRWLLIGYSESIKK